MEWTIDQLTKLALSLSPADRARLADQLVESLVDSDDMQRAWAAEAIQRRDDIRAAKVAAIPVNDVLAEARRLAGR